MLYWKIKNTYKKAYREQQRSEYLERKNLLKTKEKQEVRNSAQKKPFHFRNKKNHFKAFNVDTNKRLAWKNNQKRNKRGVKFYPFFKHKKIPKTLDKDFLYKVDNLGYTLSLQYMRTSNSISKRYKYFYVPKDRFGWKPRSWKQVFAWFEKGTIVIRKGYTFRKRSVDFAPLAWRNYYWVRNRYSTPVTYKPIWDQLEFLRDKRSDYINLKLKKRWKNWKARESFRKWSYLAYKHNPYKIVRNLGKYLILQQKYRDLKFSAQGRIIRNKLRLRAHINFYKKK